MTSVSATRQFCLRNNLRPYCLVEDELIEQDFVGVEMHDPNCVLVGLAPTKFCYESLNGAFRLLLRLKKSRQEEDLENDNVEHCKVDDTTAQGAAASTNQYIKCNNQHPLLVAIHQATRFRENDREFSLGPGGFVSLLEQTAGVSAHVVGKPSVNFYHAAVSSLQLDYLSEVVMVGDDVVGGRVRKNWKVCPG